METFESQTGKVERTFTEEDQRNFMLDIKNVLKSNDDLETIGFEMYKMFKSKEYSVDAVLSSIKEIYEEEKDNFDAEPTFFEFIKYFGTGFVMLFQEKLFQAGFDLGKYGDGNGIDGKFGKKTRNAYKLYLKGQTKKAEPDQETETSQEEPDAVSRGGTQSIRLEASRKKTPSGESEEDQSESDTAPATNPATREDSTELTFEEARIIAMLKEPYKPGTKEYRLSPKSKLVNQIQQLYEQQGEHTLSIHNVRQTFGHTKEQVERYIVPTDPVIGGKITFLGKEIEGGVNRLYLPILKMIEFRFRKLDLNYKPKAEKTSGYNYRTMSIGGQLHPDIPSFHLPGLAIDIDASTNGPTYDKNHDHKTNARNKKMNRGDMPDELVLEMSKYFVWGAVAGPNSPYLGDDPMHFELHFDPRDNPKVMAEILNDPVGRIYWKAIEKGLPKKKEL